jgi:ankyrin repeat protein
MTPEWEQAARTGAIDVLERLAANGAHVDAKDRYGQTALMVAAREGRDPVVRWLLSRGADPDQTAKYGLSALMLAAINRRRTIVGMLVEAGADRTLRGTGAPGFADRTALDLALAAGDEEIVRMLREADGAD